MWQLDKDQISLIEMDVERARVTLINLSDELVDHICCEVENYMSDGKSFEEAYALIKEQTGIKVLQQIQEDTLYLTNKTYALMKTTMKITGNLSLALIGVGTTLKIFHWPGAGPALLLGFILLCIVFFPASIYLNYIEGGEKKRPVLNLSILIGGIILMAGILFKVMHWPGAAVMLFGGWTLIIFIFLPILLIVKLKGDAAKGQRGIYVLGVIGLMIFELATLFKIQHWPGAGPLMIMGAVLLIGIFLPAFTYNKFKRAELKIGQFIFLIIVSMYAVVLTTLLAYNVSTPILSRFVNEESNTSRISRYFKNKKQPFVESDNLSAENKIKAAEISGEADKLLNLISEIKLDLVQQVELVNKEDAKALLTDPEKIKNKDNYDIVTRIMIGENKNGSGTQLKNKLDKFRARALAVCANDVDITRNINTLLNTTVKNDYGMVEWEMNNFHHIIVICALNTLTEVEKKVRIVESETLANLNK